jgi:hypothetical protein
MTVTENQIEPGSGKPFFRILLEPVGRSQRDESAHLDRGTVLGYQQLPAIVAGNAEWLAQGLEAQNAFGPPGAPTRPGCRRARQSRIIQPLYAGPAEAGTPPTKSRPLLYDPQAPKGEPSQYNG